MMAERSDGGRTGASFDDLVGAALPKVKAVVRRMVGSPSDTEDIVQEAVLSAFEGYEAFRGDARFDTWLISIATRKAIDHLRRKKRWRAEAQVAHANLCAADETLSGDVISAFAAPDASFELRQHVAYCFTCVGRSLPPNELATLVLRDVVDMSAREAATVLGISDSVLRYRLTAARTAMSDKFDGLCALVNKKGICHQCSGLSEVARSMGGNPGPLPDVAEIANRMAIVREMRDVPPSAIHTLFFRQVEEIEETGAGSTVPQSDCGVDDDNR